MAIDDDIAAALPPSPPPAPARREAAIKAALQRFDAGDRPPTAITGRRDAPRPAPLWARLGRPQAGALVSAALVALIALPVAWISIDQISGGGPAERPADLAPETKSPGPVASVSPSNEVPFPAATLARNDAAPSLPAPAQDAAPPAAASTPLEQVADAQPPPAPPPPAPAMGMLVEKSESLSARGAEQPKELAARGPTDIVVTGSRVRSAQQDRAVAIAAAPARRATALEEDSDSIIVTGAKVSGAARRGDWNACTIDDPDRSLRGCRGSVNPAARGASGRASAQIADGLSLAWEGDMESAIAAFDRAIAIMPRSAFAYLNRGLAYRRNGDLDRALADLDRAVKYAPGAARGYFNRSLVLREHGDIRGGRADEDRAVDLDPGYARAVKRR